MTVVVKARGRAKSEEKRLNILCAATDLFIEFGYAGVSMDQIADKAGVSKQTLYSHFGAKADLFVAAVKSKCIQYQLSGDSIFESKPVEEVLLLLARHLIALLLSPEGVKVHRLCCTEAEQHPEVSTLFYDAGPSYVIDMLSQYLERQDQLGTLVVENPRFAACQFLFMVKGETQMRAVFNCPDQTATDQQDAYLQSCVDLFLRGYKVTHS